jgi:hypothetical protein
MVNVVAACAVSRRKFKRLPGRARRLRIPRKRSG